MKLAGFFVICFFCSSAVIVHKTKGIERQMDNEPVETFEYISKTIQCAQSRFVHNKLLLG